MSVSLSYEDLAVRTRICVSPARRRRERVGPRLNSPRAVAKFVRGLAGSDQERMVVLSLNTKSRVLSAFEAAVGGTRNVASSMQHVLKVPVITGATKVAIVHNHPSGDPEPSAADRAFYARAREGFDAVGVRLVDSIVVADGGFHSLLRGKGGGWRKAPPALRERYPVPAPAQEPERVPNPPPLRSRTSNTDTLAEQAFAQGVRANLMLRGGERVLSMVIDERQRRGEEPYEPCEHAASLVDRSLLAGRVASPDVEYAADLMLELEKGTQDGSWSREVLRGDGGGYSVRQAAYWLLSLLKRAGPDIDAAGEWPRGQSNNAQIAKPILQQLLHNAASALVVGGVSKKEAGYRVANVFRAGVNAPTTTSPWMASAWKSARLLAEALERVPPARRQKPSRRRPRS